MLKQLNVPVATAVPDKALRLLDPCSAPAVASGTDARGSIPSR